MCLASILEYEDGKHLLNFTDEERKATEAYIDAALYGFIISALNANTHELESDTVKYSIEWEGDTIFNRIAKATFDIYEEYTSKSNELHK